VSAVGEQLELDITSMAHGGEAIARHGGLVVFVRGGIPGERVRATITAAPEHGRFIRARVTEVLDASPHRVDPPCRYAGHCGGCDWQHIGLSAQRQIKARIVAEQLTRIGGEPADRWTALEVEAVPGDVDGLHWRTRMRYAVNSEGRAGLRAQHTHDVVALDECLIASPSLGGSAALEKSWAGAREVLGVQPLGKPVLLADPRPGQARVTERAAGREWSFDATAFWQVHPGAPDALVQAVQSLVKPRAGDHIVDLYSGVGLFAGAYVEALGPGGRVDAVEGDDIAVKGARRSLHGESTIHIHHDRVDRWLRRSPIRRCDLVILDPPRVGAGRDVMQLAMRLRPRAIAYVACDPAALARDVATARDHGWDLTRLRALDLFPMTHHVECVALLQPRDSLAP
jgi:tRNA/tmRNA/rRNA uracil-C5-methylase (TrmA/RlmC/RlmD family)